MTNSSLTQYRMRGNVNTPPFQTVAWYSLGEPDFTGEDSGYPLGTLTDIVIDGQPINLVSSVQFNNPTGPASGDLTGSYPAPVVSGLQTIPISTTAPVSGQVLTYNGINWGPAAGGGISFFNSAIFQPGGTTSGNTYTNFGDAITALNAIQGIKYLIFDLSHNSDTVTIPAGSYDHGYNCNWISSSAYTSGSITFDNGVIITTFPASFTSLALASMSIAPVFVISNTAFPLGNVTNFVATNSSFAGNSSSSLILINFTGYTQTYLYNSVLSSFVISGIIGNIPISAVSSTIMANAIDPTNLDLLIELSDISNSIDISYSSYTAFGALPLTDGYVPAWNGTNFALTDGYGIGYFPTVPGDWVHPQPSTIQNAIDRMAALLVSKYGAIP